MMYVINDYRMHPSFIEDNFRDYLVAEAKSYGIKGVSRMNRRQLSVAILEHLVKREGNYMSPMDEIEKHCCK